MKSSCKFAIVSKERKASRDPSLFCAIHGFSPFYVMTASKAKKFDTQAEAEAYANAELFTSPDAFEVIVVAA